MLSTIKSSQKIFIDSNVFIYHFLGLNENVSRFLQRCEQKDITALTSSVVVAEVWHRLTIAEVIELYNVAPLKAVSYLKSHPQVVKELVKCHAAISSIPKFSVKIWPLTESILHRAQAIVRHDGLLTNDALNLATMESHRIKNIATNDRDFERIKNVIVHRP